MLTRILCRVFLLIFIALSIAACGGGSGSGASGGGSAQTYVITFDMGGVPGMPPEPVTVAAGSAVGNLPEPQHEDWFFDGWYILGSSVSWSASSVPSGDVILRAAWTAAVWLSFDTGGGSAVDAVRLRKGSFAGILTRPTLSGHVFTGWSTSAAAAAADFYAYTPVERSLTVYAVWAPEEAASCSAVFHQGSGGADVIIRMPSGAVIGELLPAEPEREGWRFAYWIDSGGDIVDESTVVRGDLAVDAVWIKTWKLTVVIDGVSAVYVLDDGSAPGTERMPRQADKLYRPFLGWSTLDADGAVDFTAQTPVYSDLVVSAVWQGYPDDLTVDFDLNGGEGSISSKTVPYSGMVSRPDDPSRAGHGFSGWLKGGAAYDFSSGVFESFTLTADWTRNTYNVRFAEDFIGPIAVLHGDAAVIPALTP